MIPIISQCPVIVSFPLLASFRRKNFPLGSETAFTPFNFFKFPTPIFWRWGMEKSSIFSAICPKVSAPLSPKRAASLPFPIPRESRTIKNTLLNFIIALPLLSIYLKLLIPALFESSLEWLQWQPESPYPFHDKSDWTFPPLLFPDWKQQKEPYRLSSSRMPLP